MRVMAVEVKPRLGRSIIFTTVVVLLLTVNYCFLRLWLHHYIYYQDPILVDVHLLQGTVGEISQTLQPDS